MKAILTAIMALVVCLTSCTKNIPIPEKAYLEIQGPTLDVAARGGIVELGIKSNVSYDVYFMTDADWIESTSDKNALRVNSNESSERRDVLLAITAYGTGPDGIPYDFNKRITIQQRGSGFDDKLTIIHVEEEGTLRRIMYDNDYLKASHMKITGILGRSDFATIKELENLCYLDISELNITRIDDLVLWQSKMAEIILPKHIVEIGSSAFSSCTSLTSITIPASVETIGNGAFWGCSNLASVTFEAGSKLKTIGEDVFYDCTSLTSITIPANVETIGDEAFTYCSNLSSVTFEAGSKLKTIGGESSSSFYGAFYNCTSLTSITIPASVETIGVAAFKGCSKLASVTFEAGSKLKTLSGLNNCTSLTSITIPASVETIEVDAFADFLKLASVTFEAGSKLKTLSGFPRCTSLTSITIPANVETIGDNAFKGCSKLASVTFEAGSKLKTLGGFDFCPSLTSITIPANVETIGDTAFYECSNLASVTFEAGSKLETIGENVFYSCTSLTTFDASKCELITKIGYSAFSACTKLSLFKIGTVIPPTCGQRVFSSIGSSSVLKVPTGSIEAYKAIYEWGWSFAAIKALD